jgi:hypothetical protein
MLGTYVNDYLITVSVKGQRITVSCIHKERAGIHHENTKVKEYGVKIKVIFVRDGKKIIFKCV